MTLQDDGSCNEIYTGLVPDCIQGLNFGQATLVSNPPPCALIYPLISSLYV